MARLIFVNRFFFPDHSATSQILSDLTFHLAAAGHEVHVLASRQIYDEPDADLPPYEAINGVNVHRVASTRFGRTALPGRALDYLSFYQSVRRHLGAISQQPHRIYKLCRLEMERPLADKLLAQDIASKGQSAARVLFFADPE